MTTIGARHTRLADYRTGFAIRTLKLMLWLFPPAFIGLLIWLKLNHPWFYSRNFMLEDGPIEYGTCIAYMLACVVSIFVSATLYKNGQRLYCLLYVLLTMGLFFLSGEEISWGQRILGEPTPRFFAEHNLQGETNLHNMLGRYALQGLYIIVGFYGAFSRLIASSLGQKRDSFALDLLTPNYFLVLYFFPVFALYLYYDYLSGPLVYLFGPQVGVSTSLGGDIHEQFMRARDQEPIEFLLSLGFLLFVLANYYRYATGRDAPGDSF